MNIIERVQAGVEFLNQRRPGWQDRIDTSKLDLKNANTCVLGQLTGNYWTGRPALGLDEEAARMLGFQAHLNLPNQDTLNEYASLTAVWINEIERYANEKVSV